jgi:hypothetical protein
MNWVAVYTKWPRNELLYAWTTDADALRAPHNFRTFYPPLSPRDCHHGGFHRRGG